MTVSTDNVITPIETQPFGKHITTYMPAPFQFEITSPKYDMYGNLLDKSERTCPTTLRAQPIDGDGKYTGTSVWISQFGPHEEDKLAAQVAKLKEQFPDINWVDHR